MWFGKASEVDHSSTLEFVAIFVTSFHLHCALCKVGIRHQVRDSALSSNCIELIVDELDTIAHFGASAWCLFSHIAMAASFLKLRDFFPMIFMV